MTPRKEEETTTTTEETIPPPPRLAHSTTTPENDDDVMVQQLVALARARASDQADPQTVWSVLHRDLLHPQKHDFARIHFQCYQAVYNNNANTDTRNDMIQPAWIPTAEQAQATHVAHEMRQQGFATYHQLYQWSVQSKNDFWMQAAERVGIQ